MEYLLDPFRTVALWAGMAYSISPGVCQGAAVVLLCLGLAAAVQVVLIRTSK